VCSRVVDTGVNLPIGSVSGRIVLMQCNQHSTHHYRSSRSCILLSVNTVAAHCDRTVRYSIQSAFNTS
jgi:hypothetical protein